MRLLFLALACSTGTLVDGQTVVSDRAAKDAVHRIVRYSGLPPNFMVREDAGVRTAVAYIKDKQRVIAYNPAFIARIVDSSATDWSAISVLAHEVGHHLMGHTLDPSSVHPGDELACDRYSGFILAAMGISLQESRAAMEVAGDPHGTERHPPRHARLTAIEQGWNEWHRLRSASAPEQFTLQDPLQYVVTFHGDDNTYYVDAQGDVLWYDERAAPIAFGHFGPSEDKSYTHELVWSNEAYFVDARLTIWRRAETGMALQVGRMRAFSSR